MAAEFSNETREVPDSKSDFRGIRASSFFLAHHEWLMLETEGLEEGCLYPRCVSGALAGADAGSCQLGRNPIGSNREHPRTRDSHNAALQGGAFHILEVV